MKDLKPKYSEETPYGWRWEIINGRSVEITDRTRFIARDFSMIPAWSCIECHRPYDRNHTERFEEMFDPSFFAVYSAKSGFCPDCVRRHRGNPVNEIHCLKEQKKLPRKTTIRPTGYKVRRNDGRFVDEVEITETYDDGLEITGIGQ